MTHSSTRDTPQSHDADDDGDLLDRFVEIGLEQLEREEQARAQGIETLGSIQRRRPNRALADIDGRD